MITAAEARDKSKRKIETEIVYILDQIDEEIRFKVTSTESDFINCHICRRWSDLDYNEIVENIISYLQKNGYFVKRLDDSNNYIILYITWREEA